MEVPHTSVTDTNVSSLDDGDVTSDCASSVHTGCSTPNYLKWTRSFSALLEDTDGYRLFSNFTQSENCNRSLDFLYAFQGVKQSNDQKILSAIYKTYFASAGASACYGIKAKTRKAVIKHCNENNNIIKDYKIFEPAFKEVEEYMVSVVHPNFLESDLYLAYVQKKQAGVRTPSEESRGSISPDLAAALSNAQDGNTCGNKEEVPIVWHKHHQQKNTYLNPYSSDSIPEGACGDSEYMNGGKYVPQPINPYAVYSSYVPVTAQTSEKMSSENTDFSKRSGEGRSSSVHENRARKKAIFDQASQNWEPADHLVFIPRIDVGMPRKNDVTASNIHEFAKYLIKKLELLKLQQGEESCQPDQDILDSHCSRTWPTDQPQFPEEKKSFSTPLQRPNFSPTMNNINFAAVISNSLGKKSSKSIGGYNSKKIIHQNASLIKEMERAKLKDSKRIPNSTKTRHDQVNHKITDRSSNLNHHGAPLMANSSSNYMASQSVLHTQDFGRRTDEVKHQKPLKRNKEENTRLKSSDKISDLSGSSRRNLHRASAPAPLQPVSSDEHTVAVYRFLPEQEFFKVKIPGKNITLLNFKNVVKRKGKFRYFFKTIDTEFGAAGINEEYNDDTAVCPLWEGKIHASIEPME